MRKREKFESKLALGLLAAIMLIGVATASHARNLPPPPAETGYPPELINRPVCWTRPLPGDGPHCGTIDLLRHGARAPF
jgi:hypothetical protein